MRNRINNQIAPTQVSYLIPPPAQRAGGIDTALDGLTRHLAADSCIEVAPHESTFAPDSDLVHFHGMWQTQHRKAYDACQAKDIPYIVSPHGMLEPWAWRHKIWKKWPYYQLIERRNLRNATAVFAASALEADNLARFIDRSRVQVLPFGIDAVGLPDRDTARKRLGFELNEHVLLYFSRVDQKKGLDLLLEALRETPTQNCRLVVVGDGDAAFTEELHTFAAAYGVELPPITWAGAVWGDQRWDYFVGADLFCLPTRSENFGFAVLEALWAGTPVITTSATPWSQHSDVDGVEICSPDIPALRNALTLSIQGQEFDSIRRKNLRNWCQANYHWKAVAARYADTYGTLAAHTTSTICLPS